MEGTMASIILFAGNFSPRYWAYCNGQTLAISSNSALFSLLGTTYGGNGTTTFQLPNLQSRVPMGTGTGPGLSNYTLGQQSGVENVTLTTAQLPAHAHTLRGVTEVGTSSVPTGNLFANTGALDKEYGTSATTTAMHANSITNTGGGQAHTNIQPYMALSYIICTQGVFPSRN